MRWVVFDFGQVIGLRTEAVPELAARVGAPLPEFEVAYWANRAEYDRLGDDLAYWRAVAGEAVDAALAAELTELDEAGWLTVDPAAIALIVELSERGVPMALLSNAPSSFGRAVRAQPWAKYFRTLLFSADLGVTKPDRAIYETLLDRIDALADDCFFTDDRQANVDGAIAVGLRAARWHSADALRPHLVEFGALAQ
ncbi:MAG TPA: HAD-IA family hydrolase [Pseudonocardiaceae bacterium]|jgi:putative hydrolase of the HAD superfamily|nr:HAD-IA family hydrolase [Pseudonocardiaceae bacterium]